MPVLKRNDGTSIGIETKQTLFGRIISFIFTLICLPFLIIYEMIRG